MEDGFLNHISQMHKPPESYFWLKTVWSDVKIKLIVQYLKAHLWEAAFNVSAHRPCSFLFPIPPVKIIDG